MDWFLWLWLGIFVIALLIEFITADMVSIWFSIAAIPSFILALLSVQPVVQIMVFVVFAIVLLVLTRPVVMKYFKTNEIKTNVDAIIGSIGTCTEKIVINEIGHVKIKNQIWSAISNQTIEIDDHVRVLDVEGVKLVVEKID
ncbi:MAG: NfeD family protein [Acholeplasmataceae bacterium]|nr:NfeD family protein [Acholeplasmataceae bacterium]